jgi:hypothetical protein
MASLIMKVVSSFLQLQFVLKQAISRSFYLVGRVFGTDILLDINIELYLLIRWRCHRMLPYLSASVYCTVLVIPP